MNTVACSCIHIDALKLLLSKGYQIIWDQKAGEISMIEARDILDFDEMI